MTHAIEPRTLGRTGVTVSPLCLGAMMFGAWGNPDHDESVRIIHAALDAGINFIYTADVYARGSPRRSWPRPWRPGGVSTSCWPPRPTGRWGTTPTSGRLADEAVVQLAIAWVIRHPAVTAAIIGPRTMEQLESQLPGGELAIPDDVLDRIDEIVPPGRNVNHDDDGWSNPALAPEARRRA